MSEQPGAGEGWVSPGWTPPSGPAAQPGPAQQPAAPQQAAPQQAVPQPSAPHPPAPQHGYPQQPGYPQQQGYPAPQGYPGQQPAGAPGGYAPTYYGAGWQAPVGPPPAARRDGVRLALRVVGGLVAVAVLVGAVIGVRTWQQGRAIGAVTKPATVSAKQVATGHCLAELPADGDVGSARLVPCGEPHVAEVVGSMELDGGTWPGWSRVSKQLTAWCEMDTRQAELGLRPVIWGPTPKGWSQGDRVGLCLAWSPDGALQGSFVAGDPVTNVEDAG